MARKRETQSVDVANIEANARCPEIATFARTLNGLLEIRGKHQSDLEKATGLSSGGISDYRNGKSAPGLVSLIKMADCLGVDCHYLMTGVQAKNYETAADLGLSDAAINWFLRKSKESPELIDLINRLFSVDGLADMFFSSMLEYCISHFTHITFHNRITGKTEEKGLQESEMMLKFYAQEQYSVVLNKLKLNYSDFSMKKAKEISEHLEKEIAKAQEAINAINQAKDQ